MKLKIILPSLIILLLIIVSFTLPLKTALVFYEENTNNIEAFLPLNPGDRFEIIFTHSIHLTDVVERYRISDDLEIIQDEIIFEHFGIGMPSNAEGEATFEYKDGKYHISNLNETFESLNIRNGKTVSEHRLLWESENESGKHKVWFNEYFEPGAWFTLEIDKLSLWQYLKGVRIDDGKE